MEEIQTVLEKETEGFSAKVTSSPDKLKAFLELKRKHGGPQITYEDLLNVISPPLSKEILSEDVLKDLVAEVNAGKTVAPRRIAKGKECVDGKDWKYVPLVKPYDNPKKDGQIDFIDTRYFRDYDNVEKGTAIVRMFPPVAGTDGMDYSGKVIRAYIGKSIKVKFDKTISLKPASEQEPYETLIAEQAGFVTEEKGALTIRSHMPLQEVSLETGDINFVGSVYVKGDVMKNFKVLARKDIQIDGSAHSARLISQQGSVSVKDHISGNAGTNNSGTQEIADGPDFQVVSAGNFTVGSIADCSVYARGNIEIAKEARSCILQTKRSLLMPKGHLYGGETHCVCGVEAKILGTEMGSLTKIILCSDIESSAEYTDLAHKIKEHEHAVELLQLQLGPYADDPQKIKTLNAQTKVRITQLLQTLTQVRESHQKLIGAQKAFLDSAHFNSVFRVNFLERAYAGVLIIAGDVTHNVRTELKGPGTIEYLPEEKKFAVVGLKPIQCEADQECALPSSGNTANGSPNNNVSKKG